MPGGAAARETASACLTALTTASVEALPFLMMLSRTERRPSVRTMFCCTALPSCTCPTSLTKTVAPLTNFTGMLLRSSMVVGTALVRTVNCVSPIFAVPGRQRQVLGVDRVDDVERRQPLGLQLQRIDIDHDLAVFAAGRGRQRDAVDRRELLPQAVDAVVVELLLVERVGGQPDLQHGNARGVVLDHDRRLDPGRHQDADKIGRRHDLRDREIEIDVGLKEDLLNRNAVEGLRLDILDAVHARRQRILAVGRDPLFHLRRAEPGVLPDDGDDGDVDLGKDVGRHRQHGGRAEKQHEHGEHVEGVRQPQSKTNDAHDLPT